MPLMQLERGIWITSGCELNDMTLVDGGAIPIREHKRGRCGTKYHHMLQFIWGGYPLNSSTSQ